MLSPEELTQWGARVARMAATADGPDVYRAACESAGSTVSTALHPSGGGSGSAPTQLYTTCPQLPSIDHPWFHTRLDGPICVNVATYTADQPLVNMRRLSEAVTAAAATEGRARGAGGTLARMYDWKARMAAHHSKHGLESFFSRQVQAQQGLGGSPAGAPVHALPPSFGRSEEGQGVSGGAACAAPPAGGSKRAQPDEPGEDGPRGKRASLGGSSVSPAQPPSTSTARSGAGFASLPNPARTAASAKLTSFYAVKK